MAIKEFEIDADDVSVTSGNYQTVVLAFKADADKLLDSFSVEEIVDHCDAGALLDAIGEDVALRHFDVTN